ncbi:MAG TPA: twin-arginine translocation signal domain-containing protein [Candidatus Marinimicrobia bacterium]|jgi:peptide/nickel transport system substrate-binding protein|nr:twin-arginine translocation signal domain-containing protein [Candidatus Neomarinimicrobiota bacterium]
MKNNEELVIERRKFLKTSGAIAVGATFATLLPSNVVKASKRGGTLSMLVQPEVPTLASYLSTSMPVGQTASKIYDGLLEYNFDLSPRPCLAESWNVSPDGLTITFNIRKGVKFHDGHPMTSEDVRYSIMEVLIKYHARGGKFKIIESIQTPDDHTVLIKLKSASPALMMAFSGYETPIIPKHLFAGKDIKNHPLANKPIGAGPFKFVEWKRGQYMRFDRNPDYWSPGQPYFDRIVVQTIPDSATRSAVLEKGDFQLAGFGAVPNNDAKRLGALPNLIVTTKGYENFSPISELDFNTKVKPFNNKKVRQAVAYCIDRKFVIEHIWFDFGKIATGPINSNFEAAGIYTNKVKNYDVSNRIEVANRLLDEAGYPRKSDGYRFEITHDITPYGSEWQSFGEYTVQQLDKIGIKARLRVEDVATWLKRIYTNYDFTLSSNWLNTFADPVLGVHRLYHSNAIKPGTVFKNASRWSSPLTDKLMDMASVEPDQEERGALYQAFQKILVEEVPVTWIHEIQFPTVINAQYKDVITSAIGIAGNFREGYKA